MTDDRPAGGQLDRWISLGATIVAPATLLSALLFYFGYVSSRSQYEYFGVDVDTIGLSTQDYVMRSPQPLLVPLLALTLAGVGFVTLHTAIRRRIGSAVDGAGAGRAVEHIRRVARRSVRIGLALLCAGVVLLFAYAYVRDWTLYNFVTPLLIAAGAAVMVYASRVLALLRRRQQEQAPAGPPQPASASPTSASPASASPALASPALASPASVSPASVSPRSADASVLLRRSADVLIYVVIAACIFWATATIAQWSGRGVAQYNARHLDRLPSVILDTKERLFLRAPGIDETMLPGSEGQTYRYRYRHLRLLIQGDDRMFLVPDTWSASNSTLIVTMDGSIRVQFQFQNDPP